MIGGLLIAVDSIDCMGQMPPMMVNETLVHNNTLTPVEIFTFSSIISAVDPVAVLAM